jgi:hypothetical protein
MIDKPQALVTYPGGASGEWLAIQIGKHDKYYSEETEGSDIGNNRWRLRHNWRMQIEGEFLSHFQESMFDNSPEWWTKFYTHVPDKVEWYEKAHTIMNTMKGGKIPVHRSHNGWYDCFWKDMFTDFKTITIKAHPFHQPTVDRIQNNFIKKVLWQELHWTDYAKMASTVQRELKSKAKRHNVDYDMALEILQEMPVVNILQQPQVRYIDMMYAVFRCQIDPELGMMTKEQVIEKAISYGLPGIKSWNQYHHRVDDSWHVVDFKKMFLDKDYLEYVKMCEFLEMQAWPCDKWLEELNAYLLPDEQEEITVQDVRDRLEKHQ